MQPACRAYMVSPNSFPKPSAENTLQYMHTRPTLYARNTECVSCGLILPAPSLRTDLEKAIAAHGGQGVVAAALGWPLKARHRRPKGYWDDLVNVRAAIDEFIAEQGMEAGESARLRAVTDTVWLLCTAPAAARQPPWCMLYHLPQQLPYCTPLHQSGAVFCAVGTTAERRNTAVTEFVIISYAAGVMPLKNDFVRANRLYLAKVVERWGGLPQLAEVSTLMQYADATNRLHCKSGCSCDGCAMLWHTWHPAARGRLFTGVKHCVVLLCARSILPVSLQAIVAIAAQLLEYQLASEGRGSVEWRAHIAEVAKQNPGISGKMVRLMRVAPFLSSCGAAAVILQARHPASRPAYYHV